MAIKFLNSVAVDTDVLFVDTANERVGIGTASPSALLDVGGGDGTPNGTQFRAVIKGTGTRTLYLDSDGNTSSLWWGAGNTPHFAIDSQSGGGAAFWTYSNGWNRRMDITAAGNVGIGTTSPSQKLHVNGNARVTGAYYDSGNTPGTVNQVLASTATGTAWIDPSTIVAEAATLVVIACKNTSGAAIAQGTPVYQTGTVGATATIEIAPADALISANKLPAIGLLQTALNNNGFGNVVITGELTNFTTDPIDGLTPTTGDKIFVKSGGGLTLTKPTGEGNGIQNMGLVGKVSGGNAGSITVSSIMRTNDVPNLPEGRIWVGDGNTIVSDTVYIDEPNNRLGIGTTSPGAKLDIYGESVSTNRYSLQTFSSTGQPVISIYNSNSDATPVPRIVGTNSYINMYNGVTVRKTAGSGNILTVNDPSNSEKFIVDASGNVGIGTTSPSEKLEVAGQYGNTTLSGHALGFTRAAGNYLWAKTSGGDLRFTVNGNPIGSASMIINSSGNVGIGTTSPSEKLDVNGNTIVRGDIVAIDTYPSIYVNHSGTAMGGIRADATSKLELKTLTTAPLSFQVNSSEKMRILDNGNVGIGTTNPGEPLTVKTKTDAYFPGIKIEDYNSTMGLYVQNIEGLNSGIGTGRYYNSGSWRSDVTVPTAIRLDGGAIRFYAQSGVTADANYTPTQRMIINANGAISLNAYGNGSFGGSGGFLLGVNTSGGVYEANAADLPGGPYLPLAGGTMTGAITLIDGSTTETSINFTGDPNTGIYQPADNLMGFVSNGSRKLLVNTAGVTVQNGNLFINSDSSSSANNRIIMGAGNDLQIYHDGSNSYIDDTGTGHLVLNTNGASMKFLFGSEFMAQFEANGSVDLYHNNSKKFETTSTGVTVTGAATATTFLGDLNGTINTVTTAVTKANATNDTTVATTAFVQNLIGTIPAGLVFQGTWDAATNTPTLTSGSGTTGHFYIVSTSGSTNLDGVTDWVTGDWAVFIEQGATDAWEKIDNSSVLDGIGTGNRVAKWSGSGTSNTLTNSGIQDASNAVAITINGNEEVGIGTVSPFSILHTKTSAENVGRFESTDATAYIQINDNADSFYIGTGTQYGSIGGNAGLNANNLNISLTTGNVGIGTTSPSAKLHVSGDSSSGNLPIAKVESTGTISYLKFFNSSTGTGSSDGAYIGMNGGTAYFMNKEAGNLYLGTGDNFNLTLENGGNVGIGTTNPGTKLHISAPGGSSQLTLERTGGGAGKAVLAGAAEGLIVYDDLYGPKMYVGTSGTYNGNVGIGTISPTQKLHVDGNTLISAERYYYTAGTGAGFGSDASGNFKIRQNDADLIFGSGNNVGIGTTNPSYKLDVDEITSGNLIVSRFKHNQGGVASAMQLENRAGAVNSAFDINWGLNSSGNQGTVGVIRTNLPAAGGSEMYFKTSYGEVMRLDGAGKVGIGTTSPDRPLSVVGGNSMVARFQSTNTTSFIQFSNTVSTADQVRIGSNGNNLVLSTNYAERMRITSAGDTGIGVTTPRAKLDVAGGIKVADDTDTAGANKVGTLRYRTSGNNSYVDMCMQTGASTYAWINVVQNNW